MCARLAARCGRAWRAGAWFPIGTAVAHWTLVGCALLASSAYTLGYLGRVSETGGRLADLGRFTEAAELTGALTSFAAYLMVVPATWWLIWASFRRGGVQPHTGDRQRRAVWRRIWLLALTVIGRVLPASLRELT